MSLWARGGKRTFDFVASAIALVLLCPLLGAIAIAVRLDSPGRIFFRQKRIGKGGRLFEMIKYRTMIEGSDNCSPALTVARDRRLTRLGGVLRRFELDELPTLLNVLKGDMSVVGPRPELPRYLSAYEGTAGQVLSVRPGITDLGTLRFRTEGNVLASKRDPEAFYLAEILPQKIALGREYIRLQSFVFDTHIVLKTWLQILRQPK